MSVKLITSFAFASFASIGLMACGSSGEHRNARAADEKPRAIRYDTELAGTPNNLTVNIHDEVARICNIPQDTAFFDYNSVTLDAQDQTVLIMVAECMNNGPLKGRAVIASGYADYRGAYVANADLGLDRSRAVAAELMNRGVSAERIFIRSYGEIGASYPGDMAIDRRVELRLVEPTEAPI